LRKRSPGSFIEEIKAVKGRWPLKMVEFIDDEFAYEQQWVERFAEQYRREINLPFSCLVRKPQNIKATPAKREAAVDACRERM
jgi:hypothetical protein